MSFNWLNDSLAKAVNPHQKFKQLGMKERLLLAFFLKQGYTKAAIAQELKVHRSTIYRELARNQDEQFGYHVY